jgi:hypothetical protein
MQIQARRSLVAALVALLVLLSAHWFDAGVLVDVRNGFSYTYDPVPLVDLTAIAHIVTAAGVLAIALAGWRSRSLAVGIAYAVVGGFLVFLPPLIWSVAVSVNGTPPVAPQPVANTLWSWDSMLETGRTGAVFTLAAAMFLTGVAVIWSVLQGRHDAAAAVEPVIGLHDLSPRFGPAEASPASAPSPIHLPSEPEADRNLGEFPADSEDDRHVGAGLVETKEDVTLEPLGSVGIAIVPRHPSDKR